MTEQQEPAANRAGPAGLRANWGAWLFYGTLVVTLIFFWWLLIDSGGVSGHHG